MSIADKLKTVAQKMEDVYRSGLFKYAPKLTASGETILLENSAPEPFVSMTVHGKSWQNGTPTPSAPIEIESAKEIKVLGGNYFNINNFDESIQDNGVYRKDNGFAMQNYYNGIYTRLGVLCPELKDGDEVYLNLEVENRGSTVDLYLYGSGRDWIPGNSLVITQADLDDGFSVYGIDGETTIYKNIIVSKEPIPFEPYKEPQTLNLPTLRGIGEHRDYVDYVNKKHVREYAEYVFTGEEDFDDLIESYDAITTRFPHKSSSPFLCTHAITDDTRGSYWANDNNLAFCSSAFGVTSVEEFKNLLREKYNSNIPCKIVYQVAEPIETDLTDDQIYAFKRMRANSPNTTIIGQGQVDVTYIVDNRQ